MPNYGYDESLGHEGNLREIFKQNQYRKNEISNETSRSKQSDLELEIARTDAELNDIEANQLITELDIRLLELEG